MSSTPKSLAIAEAGEKRYGRVEQLLSPAILLLLRSWKLIAASTLAAFVVSAIFAKFMMTKYYRAEAILRPVSELMPNGFDLAASNESAETGLPEIGNLLGVPRAQEIITILNSFDFAVAMIDRHHMQPELLSAHGGLASPGSDPKWDSFRELKRRFKCDFSFNTGNVTMYYVAPNRANAERDLGYYIEDLRRKLRDEQIRDTAGEIESMGEKAKATPDSLAANQIYKMVANEVQVQQLAMVEADFAFKVMENPNASDRPYSPNVVVIVGIASVAALFLCCFALLVRSWLEKIRTAYERDTAALRIVNR